MTRPDLSVVVPVLHDGVALAALLATPRDARDEWIVVNGDAADRALVPLQAVHPDVLWLESAAGRGVQLAEGVARARGHWVLLLHADTQLPPGWRGEVTGRAAAASNVWGCFRLRLASGAWQARVLEAAVAARVRLWRLPYGDQAVFVRHETLVAVGGVPRHPLMEDVALSLRLGRRAAPYRSPLAVVTSARRWERDGWCRRSAGNVWLLVQYLLGASPHRLAAAYQPRAARPQAAARTVEER